MGFYSLEFKTNNWDPSGDCSNFIERIRIGEGTHESGDLPCDP